MAEAEVSMGVGDGRGDLFVHGSYAAIHACQQKLLRLEAAEREILDLKQRLARLGVGLVKAIEDLHISGVG